MSGSPIVLAAAAAAIALLLAPALGFFFAGISDWRRALIAAATAIVTIVVAGASWLAYGADPYVAFFQATIAVVAVMTILAIGLRVGRPITFVVFAPLWVLSVLVPVGYALFDIHHGLLATSIGVLDFGSASIIAVCSGTAALSFAMVGGRVSEDAYVGAARPMWLLLVCGILGAAGLVALGVGSELVFDDTTAVIVVNFAWAMAAGTIGWTAAQLVNVHRPTVAGYVAGLFAGGIVVLAGAPWLDATSSAVLGLVAGIVGHVSAVWVRRVGAGAWATPIGVLLVPGALGVLLLGLVARGSGLVFSGRLGLLASQAVGLSLVVAYSFVVSLLLAFVAHRVVEVLAATSRDSVEQPEGQ